MAKPATMNSSAEWLPLPEGLWRFVIGAPQIEEKSSQWGLRVELTFPLTLTESEQKRLKAEHGEPADGQQQSYRVWVRGKEDTACGYYKGGKYQQTDCGLAQLMCAAVGNVNGRKLREWMSAGGVPPVSPGQTRDQEWEELKSWYSWFENLEVYASIRHDPDKQVPGKVWPRVGSILPVGSIPGQPETEYQQACAGKVRTMISMSSGMLPSEPPPAPAPTAEEDEEAALAAKLAEIQAKKAAQEHAGGAPARTYNELFPELAKT